MRCRFLLRSAQVNKHQQPLLQATPKESNSITKTKTKMTSDVHHHHNNKKKTNKKFGELAGGTTAECAAVCCCCPCTVMNLLVLAVYKVPAGLWRRAWRHHRRQKRPRMIRRKSGPGGLGILLPRPNANGPTNAGGDVGIGDELLEKELKEMMIEDGSNVADDMADDLEKEMWDRFYGAGFWRSSSTTDSKCD